MRVERSDQFDLNFEQQKKVDRASIFQDLERLELSTRKYGKPLIGELVACRSIRTGSYGQLRIVYIDLGESYLLLAVGPRAGNEVYESAARVLRELGL